jgi:succinate dehydrogenase/fumarate reductase cytochrome b subunit
MGFSSMIFGFFFIFFDFNINKINILPDTIGYIWIYFTVRSIIGDLKNEHLVFVKKVSFLLIFLSALDYIIKNSSVLQGVINNLDTIQGRVFSILLMLLTIILLVALFYHLTKGIEIEALNLEANDHAEESKKLYKILSTIQVVIGLFFLFVMLFIKQQNINFNFNNPLPIIVFAVIFIYYIRVFLKLRSLLKKTDELFEGVKH